MFVLSVGELEVFFMVFCFSCFCFCFCFLVVLGREMGGKFSSNGPLL